MQTTPFEPVKNHQDPSDLANYDFAELADKLRNSSSYIHAWKKKNGYDLPKEAQSKAKFKRLKQAYLEACNNARK
jgi:uncharacterized protein YjcR